MTPVERITDHHLFWPQKAYKTKLEKRFRTHEGLVVPTRFGTQMALHANMSDPLKPHRDDMFNLLQVLEETPIEDRVSPFWGLYKAIEFFERQRVLEQHLVTQLGYVALGLEETENARKVA